MRSFLTSKKLDSWPIPSHEPFPAMQEINGPQNILIQTFLCLQQSQIAHNLISPGRTQPFEYLHSSFIFSQGFQKFRRIKYLFFRAIKLNRERYLFTDSFG